MTIYANTEPGCTTSVVQITSPIRNLEQMESAEENDIGLPCIRISKIQTLAGHRNLNTTMRYIDINDNKLGNAVELVEI